MQAIIQYLKQNGYQTIDESFYNYINLWFRWYKGKVASFHGYRQYNGRKKISRERKTLGMAKKIPEDWANLELNERVEIVVGEKALNETIQQVLMENNFWVRGNQLLEIAYALGTGAIVEYQDGERVKMDYIRAGMIYPLRWDNGEIIDCAFASERVNGKDKLVYLNIHELIGGSYHIRNQMFVRNGNHLSPTELPEGVISEVNTGSHIPLFQIIKPNIANNIDPDSPMGVSVYANAIDQLEGLDLVYDSYCNEFRLGKKRVIVPDTMAKMMMEEDGSVTPMFDDNDLEFFALNLGNDAEPKLQEINMELRAEAHEAALKTALNLLSTKCGLGNDRFSFEHGNLKTATEVVSEKSELFQNLRKHELILEKALTDMVKAILLLLGENAETEITINFDDSIIVDQEAERMRFLQEIRDGVRQKWEYRVRYLGEDETTAKKMAGGSLSDEQLMFGGGDA